MLHQREIIESLKEEYGKEVSGLIVYKTPGTLGKEIVQNPEVSSVTKIEEKKYRRGVGKLLYLPKHTRLDIANIVRELSKILDCVMPSAIKELRRVIKYVLDTGEFGLKIEPVRMKNNENVNIEVYCDSDFAGDRDTRVSVSGYIIYLCNVLVAWRSKAQKNITLSSSEAEFVSLSEIAKEVKFILQVIELMGIEVKKPVTIRVNNIGAIYIAKDLNTSQRSKHVDVRYKYVTEFIDEGFLEIIFVKSEENQSDGFTKNLSRELHEKHTKNLIKWKDQVKGENLN